MNEIKLSEYRMARLQAAIDKLDQGNKSAFGRRLGYKDGAFIRQLMSGLRPITEKTVRQIEGLHGMAGWFEPSANDKSASAPTLASWPFASIDERDVRELAPGDLKALEGALALAIAQLKLNLKVSPPDPAPRATQSKAIDLSSVEEPFPFVPSKPMPWELPTATSIRPEPRESLRISSANVGHVAHAGYSANDHEFVPVPELSVRLAAGALGIENYQETEIGEIQLRRSFLESFGLPLDRMKIVYADGNSMEPVIRHQGPMLFFEEMVTDWRQIDSRTIYAINHGGKMIVKCLVRARDGVWMARSLNPGHKDFPLVEDDGREVRIVGRILWSPYDLRNGVDERLVRR